MNLVLANAKISTAYAQNISDESLKKDKMRKKIIALFCKMGYKDQYACADMARINAWVLKYGFLNVKMNSYSYQELPKLVSQVEIVCTKYLQELNKPQA